MNEKVMFIGISRLWYTDVLDAAVDETTIEALLATMTEIYNSHEDTFTFEQDDPETTDYVNELTRKTYYIDTTNDGEMRINFSMGQYDFGIRSELEGGTVNASGKTYAFPTQKQTIEKSFVCLTRTGNLIVIPRASVVAKTDTQEKALCLGVTATVMDTGNSEISCLYFIIGEGLTMPATLSLSTLASTATAAKTTSKKSE